MTGIKLTLDESGEPDIKKSQESMRHKCLIDDCDWAIENWECGYDNVSIWEHYRNPGWCPKFKWYRTSKVKEFNKAEQNETNSNRVQRVSF